MNSFQQVTYAQLITMEKLYHSSTVSFPDLCTADFITFDGSFRSGPVVCNGLALLSIKHETAREFDTEVLIID